MVREYSSGYTGFLLLHPANTIVSVQQRSHNFLCDNIDDLIWNDKGILSTIVKPLMVCSQIPGKLNQEFENFLYHYKN